MRKLHLNISKEIEAAKRSLSYDISNKFNILKNIISSDRGAPKENLKDARQNIGFKLPISDLNEFQEFDESLSDETKKLSLITLYRACVCGETKINECISKMMMETISKTVELEYSGAGKKFKGVGKLDFSSTNTYGCLKGNFKVFV